MHARWSSLAVVLFLGWPIGLSADLLIVEKSVLKAGDRSIEGVRSTYIKGTRMRIETAQEGKTLVTVYDLPAGEMLELDAEQRRANVRLVTARNAKLEKEYPRRRTTATLTATGSTHTVAGIPCDDYALTVRVPMTKSGEIAMILTGAACLAAEAPGMADYLTFAKAAADQNLVLGQASDNLILLGFTRGQTELYRVMSMQGGVPLIVDLTITVDGKGVLAGMVRRLVAGSRMTTATRLDTADTASALYAVPAGWKRELKQ